MKGIFKVKLEGPPCSGKSTFINLILDSFKWKGDIHITKVKEHELKVEMKLPAFPVRRKEKDK